MILDRNLDDIVLSSLNQLASQIAVKRKLDANIRDHKR